MREDEFTYPDGGKPQDGSGNRVQIATDELYHILKSSSRRQIMSYLSTCSDYPVPLDELTDIVAERECPDPESATCRERILVDLHHVHLPYLVDAGVIDYDSVANTVYYDGSERLESLFDAGNSTEGTEEDYTQ